MRHEIQVPQPKAQIFWSKLIYSMQLLCVCVWVCRFFPLSTRHSHFLPPSQSILGKCVPTKAYYHHFQFSICLTESSFSFRLNYVCLRMSDMVAECSRYYAWVQLMRLIALADSQHILKQKNCNLSSSIIQILKSFIPNLLLLGPFVLDCGAMQNIM